MFDFNDENILKRRRRSKGFQLKTVARDYDVSERALLFTRDFIQFCCPSIRLRNQRLMFVWTPMFGCVQSVH